MEKINFTNGQAPAINGTNLNQLQTNVETAIDKVQENLDTAIEKLTEETIFEGMLKGGETIDLDTSSYKRLLITFVAYDGLDTNTGGVSNVMMMDLEKYGKKVKKYIASSSVPYLVNHQNQGTMWCSCEVDEDKTTFTPYIGYGADAINDTEQYYVSKIIGIKKVN